MDAQAHAMEYALQLTNGVAQVVVEMVSNNQNMESNAMIGIKTIQMDAQNFAK